MCHCEERSDEAIPTRNKIAAPFGLAMTVKKLNAFVSVSPILPSSFPFALSFIPEKHLVGQPHGRLYVDGRRPKMVGEIHESPLEHWAQVAFMEIFADLLSRGAFPFPGFIF